MTVAAEPIEIVVASPTQGAEIDFAFDWQGGASLAVTLWSTTGALADRALTHGGEWTATPAGRASGGTLTLIADPVGYDRLTIRRATPVTQEFEAPPTAAAFEAALDRLTMAVQERQGEHLGAVLAPSGAQGLRLPAWDPGALLGWSPVAQALVNVDPAFGVPAPGGVIGEANGGTGETTLAAALARIGFDAARTPDAHGGDAAAAWLAGFTVMDRAMEVDGELRLKSGATVLWLGNAATKQTGWSSGGAFVTNVGPGDDTAGGILLVNPQIDLTDYPGPTMLEVASQSGAAVVLTSAASATDDAYTGRLIEVRSGASTGLSAQVLDYVGATRTLTLNKTVALAAGDDLAWGWNDVALGFATGATDITILGGRLIGPGADVMVPSLSGQKGLGFDMGVSRASATGVYAENWLGAAFFVQGTPTTASVDIRLTDCMAVDCGCLFAVFGTDASGTPTGNAFQTTIHANGLIGYNVGHAPWRVVGGDQAKSGILAFEEANNVAIVGCVDVRLASNYTDVWPAVGTGRVGSGLSGRVGAAVRGHGRRLTIDYMRIQGDLDALVHVARNRALGGDAPPDGDVRACVDWDMRFDLYGDATLVLDLDNGLVGADVPASELKGYIRATVTSCGAFCAATAGAYDGITLDIEERGTGKRIIGTPAQFVVSGRTFASYPPGLTDLRYRSRRTFTIAANTAVSFTPLRAYGVLTIESASSELIFAARYRTTPTAQCALIANSGSANAATTGVLAGTTGAAGAFTVSAHTDGKIYLENQRVGEVTVTVETPAGAFA